MSRLSDLRRDADMQRARFFTDAEAVPRQMRPSRLMDEALVYFDPDLKILHGMETRAMHNPFAVLAAVAGLFLLARQLTTKTPGASRAGNRVPRPGAVRITSRGENHGQHLSAKQYHRQ